VAGFVARVLSAVPPASGAVVMGTGIVSIGLSIDGQETLSRVLLVLAAAVWAVLGLLLAGRVLLDRTRARREAGVPGALTGVAGTCVLGARVSLLGWHHEAAALLALAVCVWVVLVPHILRSWTTPTVGVSFMLAVSTESLAVLAAVIGTRDRVRWLALASYVVLAAGVAAYAFVFARFDLRQLLVGGGDHWVAGGALAIATLACGRAAQAAQSFDTLHGLAAAFARASLVLWIAAALWLPALIAGELVSRRLNYDLRRWSTVFPFGMYAACSFVVGDVERIGGLVDFARVWVWVAFAVWLVALAGLLRQTASLWREHVLRASTVRTR